jgi:DNA-binding transcriptional regulator YiaG
MEGCTTGQILHGSARTTEAVRRAIQHSQESLRVLAKRYGINQKTVAKWKRRKLRDEFSKLHRRPLDIVRNDPAVEPSYSAATGFN